MRDTMRPTRAGSQVVRRNSRPSGYVATLADIEDNIKGRPTGEALNRSCPEAVAVLSEQCLAIHSHLEGPAVDFAANRGEAYFRDQLLGVRVLTNEDEARLS